MPVLGVCVGGVGCGGWGLVVLSAGGSVCALYCMLVVGCAVCCALYVCCLCLRQLRVDLDGL